jgi:hypothetical protein
MAGTDISTRPSDIKDIVFEGARILFRNFAGKEGKYNAEGDRNFALILNQQDADAMEAQGWNIKYLRPREEGDQPQAWVPVSVSYKRRPPRVVVITSRGRTDIPENLLDILDWADIANVDLIIHPYSWSVNGNSGVKAYLKTIFVTIAEDELELKYADVPDSAQNVLDVGPQLELEGGQDPNVIDAEIVYED